LTTTISNLVWLFNLTRATTEGKPMEAYKAAEAAELPELVREYIALSIIWRAAKEAFWALCERIANDESLAVLWRAGALESLGATHYLPEQVAARLAYFDRALALVSGLPVGDEVRVYIEACVAAGRAETAGQTPLTLEEQVAIADLMLEKRWFNGPGRLEGILKRALKPDGSVNDPTALAVITPHVVPLLAKYDAYRQSENAYSPSQSGRLATIRSKEFAAAA
jgi:hypothetical protein